jgi:glycosyltransferase involved in cell wall biosynthesis
MNDRDSMTYDEFKEAVDEAIWQELEIDSRMTDREMREFWLEFYTVEQVAENYVKEFHEER